MSRRAVHQQSPSAPTPAQLAARKAGAERLRKFQWRKGRSANPGGNTVNRLTISQTTFPAVPVGEWTVPDSLNLLQGLKDVETSSTRPKCSCGCTRFREHFVRQGFQLPTVAIALAKKFWPDIQYVASSVEHRVVQLVDEGGVGITYSPLSDWPSEDEKPEVTGKPPAQTEMVEAVQGGGGDVNLCPPSLPPSQASC